MKNTLIIDIDTTQKYPIQIGKPDSIKKPESEEEVSKMVIMDIDCLSEALLTLIHMASINKYDTKENLIESVNTKLTKYINETP